MPSPRPIPFLRRSNIPWAVFDAGHYAACNPAAAGIGDPGLLLEHYRDAGGAAGFSPNRWFDEAWYRSAHPDIEKLIAEGSFAFGFDHYCATGYTDRAPHWLFDPDYYQKANPGLTDASLPKAGFVNGYDHYLKFGATEGRRAHEFFDPVTYGAQARPGWAVAIAEMGAFKHFLSQSWGEDEPQTSPAFGPLRYRDAYPDAARQIEAGRWHSALHHYLANRHLGTFDPLPPAGKPARSPVKSQATSATIQPRIKIHIDRPEMKDGQAAEPIVGDLDIIGWAAADIPLAAVEVFVDDHYCGRADHGSRTEGVASTFPDYAHAMFAGLRFVGPAPVTSGRHQLRIVARTEIGFEHSVSFEADFAPPEQQDGPWSLRRRVQRSEADLKLRLLRDAGLEPNFIVVLRHSPTDVDGNRRTLESLRRQLYPRRRLCDRPPDDADWIIVLDAGDELGADALLELALHRITEPAADFIYSDERRVDPATGTVMPFFKPDWSPDLLLSTNYIGRLWTAPASLIRTAGIDVSELAQIGDFDLVLRLTEAAGHVAHVPLILCERVAASDQAAVPSALESALVRHRIAGRVAPGLLPQAWRIWREITHPPLVSIIIPTAGARGHIQTALETLRTHTGYSRFEVIVIDTVPTVAAPWKATVQALADRSIRDGTSFNWSRVNNRAAALANGDVLLFLNDDVEFTDPGWLEAMVEQIQRPEVGIVGPRLLYASGFVQHAGIFLAGDISHHAFHGLAGTAPGHFGLALTQRNVSAVTGACLMVRTEIFKRLGGFDERFEISCNDVDFCLRAHEDGLLVVLTPYAHLIHHESVTRTGLPETENETLFAERWRARLNRPDPYFNRNLSPAYHDYRPEREYCEFTYPARPLATPETIRRILVVKLGHIGDFIVGLPALRRLKEHFPTASLTLLAAPGVCALAALKPAIDTTIDFEFFHPRSALGLREIAPAELADLSRRLEAERFDLAVDLRCHDETRPVLQISGATWLAGFDQAFDFPWLDIAAATEPDSERRASRTHMSDTLLDFVGKVAASFSPTPTGIASTARLAWPKACPMPPGDQIRIAIHPATGNAMRQWPAAHFATLIDLLTAAFDCWIVIIGGGDERPLALEIAAMAAKPDAVACAAGSIGLDELPGLLAGCDLFIGNNSGPQHLAAALNVPTIGIHSGVVGVRQWSPNGPSAVAISRNMVCSPCFIAKPEDCPRALACLTGLMPDSVLALARTMPAGWKSRG